MKASNKKQHNPSIRYELYTEDHRNGTLVVKNIEQNNFFVTTANKVLADKNLLQGFSKKHIAYIKTINTLETEKN